MPNQKFSKPKTGSSRSLLVAALRRDDSVKVVPSVRAFTSTPCLLSIQLLRTLCGTFPEAACWLPSCRFVGAWLRPDGNSEPPSLATTWRGSVSHKAKGSRPGADGGPPRPEMSEGKQERQGSLVQRLARKSVEPGSVSQLRRGHWTTAS